MSEPEKIPKRAAYNSRYTRILPVFRWLAAHGGTEWPKKFVALADGQTAIQEPGPCMEGHVLFEKEHRVRPSLARLKWMVVHAGLLAPQDGRCWEEYRKRVIDNPLKADFLARLDDPTESSVFSDNFRQLRLEGSTAADCLVECRDAVLWIEGKRNDWLAPGTKWDVTRDQLARNLESARAIAAPPRKDYCVILCVENDLKHHEQLLVDGYRKGTWRGGIPHIDPSVRDEFRTRIGLVHWSQVLNTWPRLREIDELKDVAAVTSEK